MNCLPDTQDKCRCWLRRLRILVALEHAEGHGKETIYPSEMLRRVLRRLARRCYPIGAASVADSGSDKEEKSTFCASARCPLKKKVTTDHRPTFCPICRLFGCKEYAARLSIRESDESAIALNKKQQSGKSKAEIIVRQGTPEDVMLLLRLLEEAQKCRGGINGELRITMRGVYIMCLCTFNSTARWITQGRWQYVPWQRMRCLAQGREWIQ
ncbi:MAG: hypothetical protein KatS3mg110_1762 [Pirellulaceae bacterium]|nr:MAG: hypothetical protein KatS3mg110_1762 [Pirellulaceae bacterium]